MKIGKKVKIDFAKIKTLDDFYNELSGLFGFPDFFGRNINALIDCLFSLRYPEDEMTKIHVATSEYLLIELHHFSLTTEEIKETLIVTIENVSLKCKEKGQEPSIVLLLK
ncbi:barstar family protein [Brenneria sp. 4F2]|uniref:Barstar family protein n=1 Tax=Brenneria izadpanahii TaxID=2722756 RepID=A0ABX7UYF3_9GAMM|nr:barstar family protein [Brenneria izadpanahii]MCG8711046.1 barstar family protein [Brenneria bubanii]QTF09856.1 barstar family protein [Brenneria izadpanahii]